MGALAASLWSILVITNCANAADNVIVLDSAEAQLTLIDEATHKVVGTEPTGKEPHHLMRRSHISAKRKSTIGVGI
jgi:hypothetical protein